MVLHFPGPYEVEYTYTATIGTVTLTHKLAVSCAVVGAPVPGATPASVSVVTKSGGSTALPTAVDTLWNFIRPALTAGNTCNGWVLWRYVPGTLERDFITAGNVTNPLGTGPGTPSPAQQVKMTMRAASGGILQINILEGTGFASNRLPIVPAGTGSFYNVLAQYLLSVGGWVLARDDSFPIAAMNVAFGPNRAVFRKRYRTE